MTKLRFLGELSLYGLHVSIPCMYNISIYLLIMCTARFLNHFSGLCAVAAQAVGCVSLSRPDTSAGQTCQAKTTLTSSTWAYVSYISSSSISFVICGPLACSCFHPLITPSVGVYDHVGHYCLDTKQTFACHPPRPTLTQCVCVCIHNNQNI